MANLIPDTRYTPNTRGALSNLMQAYNNQSRAVGAVGGVFNDYLNRQRQSKADDRTQKLFDMKVQKFEDAKQGRNATRDVYNAIANPEVAQDIAYTPEEREGIQASIAALKQYAPEDVASTSQGVQSNALDQLYSRPGVDVSKAKAFESALYKQKAQVPGTEEFEALQNSELDFYKDKKKIDRQYRIPSTAASDTLALANYARNLGIGLDPTDNAVTLKYKIRNKELANKQARDLEVNNTKDDRDLLRKQGPVLSEDNLDAYRSKLNVPLETRLLGRNDTTYLDNFFNDKDVLKALKDNGIRPKELKDMISTQLSADGNDMEDALEILGTKLTGSDKDF